MGTINYREIFDQLRNYQFETRPTLKSVALIAKEHYDEVYEETSRKFTVTIWDEKTQLDPRPVEQFKLELPLMPDGKLFYIQREGQIIGTWTTSPYDGGMLMEENVKEVSERVLDDITKRQVNEELVSIIVNELIEEEIKEPELKTAPT